MQVFTDPASGRQYSVDPATGESRWLEAAPPPPAPAEAPVYAQAGPPLARTQVGPSYGGPGGPGGPTAPFLAGGGGQPPEKKRGKGLKIAGGVVGFFVVVGVISSLSGGEDSATTSASASSSSAPASAAAPSSVKPKASTPAKAPAAPSSAAPKEEGTASQRNALRSAENYLEFKGFSKAGLIDQLSSEFADKYSKADATWAVNHLQGVNWNEQAVRAGQAYLDLQGFSRAGLIQQLSSPYADKFTKAEATYAAKKLGL